MVDILTHVHNEAVKMGYKELSALLGISKPAACKKISKKQYSLQDAEKILSVNRRIMVLDKK